MRRRSGIHSTGQDGAEHAVLHKHLEAPRNVCREIAPVMNTWSHVVVSRTRSAPKGSESATSVPRPCRRGMDSSGSRTPIACRSRSSAEPAPRGPVPGRVHLVDDHAFTGKLRIVAGLVACLDGIEAGRRARDGNANHDDAGRCRRQREPLYGVGLGPAGHALSTPSRTWTLAPPHAALSRTSLNIRLTP